MTRAREINGYEKRQDKDGTNIYIRKITGKMFYSELEALRDFYKRACYYGSTCMVGNKIHNRLFL